MRDGRYGATFGSLESITQNDVYCGPGTSGTVLDDHYRQSRIRIARAQLLAMCCIFKSTSSPPSLAKRMRLHSELFSEEAGLSIIVSNSASPSLPRQSTFFSPTTTYGLDSFPLTLHHGYQYLFTSVYYHDIGKFFLSKRLSKDECGSLRLWMNVVPWHDCAAGPH